MVGKLRVWHIPQVPGIAFYVDVRSIREAAKILDEEAWWETRLRQTPNGRCIRQLPDGRCSKYSIRPKECKEYQCDGDEQRHKELICMVVTQ